jgi:hypothetical protein
MNKEKITEFIGSDEHFKIIEKIGNFLKITWENERMPKIINLTEDIIRYNQTSETQVKELIKKWLDFLNEEEINNLYNFLNENFLPKVRELWQEEDIIETEIEGVEKNEETFEEKEKRYIELMKEIIKHPQFQKKEKIKEEIKKEEPKKEVEEIKTITFEPPKEKREAKEETTTENLPEEIIVITKKEEKEEEKKEEEKFLDLSNL